MRPLTASVFAAPALALALGILPAAAQAQEEALEERVEQLEQRLEQTERKAREADRSRIKWHLTGYAESGFTFTDESGENNTFEPGRMIPIFHFLYDDVFLAQAETIFELDEDGEVNVDLEYANIAVFAHDRLTLVAGSFLSPIGVFQERLHPGWINKLPTGPVGFGHHGVGPETEIGLQARGGAPIGDEALINYVLYVGNGPVIDSAHGHGGHHAAEGEVSNRARSNLRDRKAYGGRLGVLPIPHVEFGASFLYADKLTATDGFLDDVGSQHGFDEPELSTNPDYLLWGFDANYTRGPWDLRFEYFQTELDRFEINDTSVPRSKPSAWYAQVAYQFGPWEPVVRYGEYDNERLDIAEAGDASVAKEKTNEFAVGLNYLFRPSVIASIAYRHQDRDFDEDIDTVELQFTFAF